jgi:hypothetical protein
MHDIGDTRGALVGARAAVAPTGAVLLVEPFGADDLEGNLNPMGRMFYAVPTLACTPNASPSGRRHGPSRSARRPARSACVIWLPGPGSAGSAG